MLERITAGVLNTSLNVHTVFVGNSCHNNKMASLFDDDSTRDSDIHSECPTADEEISVVDSPAPDDRTRLRCKNKTTACSSNVNGHGKDSVDWLLMAVRRVRDQKQRPNIDRVSNTLRIICPGRFTSRESIQQQLEKAVADGVLLRVGAAGDNCSYRDPGRAVRLKSHSLNVLHDTDLTKLVVRAIRDLSDDLGSTPADVHRYVRSGYAVHIQDDVDLLSMIRRFCTSAVECGKLVRVEGSDEEHYKAVCKAPKEPSPAEAKKSSSAALFDRAFKNEVAATPSRVCSVCGRGSTFGNTGSSTKINDSPATETDGSVDINSLCAANPDHKSLRYSLLGDASIKRVPSACISEDVMMDCGSQNEVAMLTVDINETLTELNAVSQPVDEEIMATGSDDARTSTDKLQTRRRSLFDVLTDVKTTMDVVTLDAPLFEDCVDVTADSGSQKSVDFSIGDVDVSLANPAEEHPQNKSEEFVSCFDCGISGHGTCLGFSDEVAARIRSTRWQCDSCKKCSVCGEPRVDAELVHCGECDRGFHMTCLHVLPTQILTGSWKCSFCDFKRKASWRFGFMMDQSIRKKFKDPNAKCPTPGCDGTGNINGRSAKHRKAYACPLLSADKRPPKPKKLLELIDHRSDSDDDSMAGENDNLPSDVTAEDRETYKQVRQKALEATLLGNAMPEPNSRNPPCIEFGRYEVTTWYSAPYPQEYASLAKLYICEFCLKYIKSASILQRHLRKCDQRCPPGNEIYRQENLSVFEVDGNRSKIYCQNLCLLAKLFLDHKTLYYDVESFYFYVLTISDDEGRHLIGYFSKEKYCRQKYNLSCIMTLPHYQRQGYGRFLIDFSFLLSRVEGQPGTPERPLSDLGRLSYESYWKSVVLMYLHAHREDKTTVIAKMCEETGICASDIISTFHLLDFLVLEHGRFVLSIDWSVVDSYVARNSAHASRLALDRDRLQWTPTVGDSMSDEDSDSSDDENEKDRSNRSHHETVTLQLIPKMLFSPTATVDSDSKPELGVKTLINNTRKGPNRTLKRLPVRRPSTGFNKQSSVRFLNRANSGFVGKVGKRSRELSTSNNSSSGKLVKPGKDLLPARKQNSERRLLPPRESRTKVPTATFSDRKGIFEKSWMDSSSLQVSSTEPVVATAENPQPTTSASDSDLSAEQKPKRRVGRPASRLRDRMRAVVASINVELAAGLKASEMKTDVSSDSAEATAVDNGCAMDVNVGGQDAVVDATSEQAAPLDVVELVVDPGLGGCTEMITEEASSSDVLPAAAAADETVVSDRDATLSLASVGEKSDANVSIEVETGNMESAETTLNGENGLEKQPVSDVEMTERNDDKVLTTTLNVAVETPQPDVAEINNDLSLADNGTANDDNDNVAIDKMEVADVINGDVEMIDVMPDTPVKNLPSETHVDKPSVKLLFGSGKLDNWLSRTEVKDCKKIPKVATLDRWLGNDRNTGISPLKCKKIVPNHNSPKASARLPVSPSPMRNGSVAALKPRELTLNNTDRGQEEGAVGKERGKNHVTQSKLSFAKLALRHSAVEVTNASTTKEEPVETIEEKVLDVTSRDVAVSVNLDADNIPACPPHKSAEVSTMCGTNPCPSEVPAPKSESIVWWATTMTKSAIRRGPFKRSLGIVHFVNESEAVAKNSRLKSVSTSDTKHAERSPFSDAAPADLADHDRVCDTTEHDDVGLVQMVTNDITTDTVASTLLISQENNRKQLTFSSATKSTDREEMHLELPSVCEELNGNVESFVKHSDLHLVPQRRSSQNTRTDVDHTCSARTLADGDSSFTSLSDGLPIRPSNGYGSLDICPLTAGTAAMQSRLKSRRCTSTIT